MKVQIYLDVYPWSRLPEHFYPTTQPTVAKMPDCTRYKIEVEIPDPAKPDGEIKSEAVEAR